MRQKLTLELDMLCVATTMAMSGKPDAYKKMRTSLTGKLENSFSRNDQMFNFDNKGQVK